MIRRLWGFSWRAGLTLLIPLIGVIAWYVWQADKFDLSVVEKMPARTILIDRNGVEYGTIHGENRRLITDTEISDFLKKALFAREDSRFLDHEGVDFIGLARATVRNIKDRDFTQGASTLSMQLARNTYELREKKSLNRKFLEIALTYRIEANFSKDEILTHYLNRIYFGSGCNGIEEAALTYFGKSTSELNRNHCALLVGIIRAPHACSPWRNLEGALKQRDEVLARLIAIDEISEADAYEIKKEDLGLRERDSEIAETSHGTRVMRRPLEIVFDQSQIKEGGLRVTTSLDIGIQRSLEELVKTTKLPEGAQMATLALDPRNGDILGVVGCREERPSGFNRALDSRRDLGSELIEALINTASLERGHLPIKGRPVSTGRQLGYNECSKLLRRFGMEGVFGSGDDLFRGTLSISPLELATAYATILEGGSRPAPVFIRKVENEDNVLFSRPPAVFPAFNDHAIPEDLPVFIEGYSLSHSDYWTISLGKECLVVSWVGFDQPKRIEIPQAAILKMCASLKALSR
ncbi:penicillin-binding protein [Akkermansiaceae bacterium]|nr:penicillin-binding protein [Akkermansiaceae bacterium]